MSLRTSIGKIYNFTREDLYLIYVAIRETTKGAIWLRSWWRTRTAFDKWIMRVAGAHTMIGAMPGVILGVLVGLMVSGPIPSYSNLYYFDWQVTLLVVTAFVAIIYYALVGRFLLEKLKGPLRLEQPSEVTDQIMRSQV